MLVLPRGMRRCCDPLTREALIRTPPPPVLAGVVYSTVCVTGACVGRGTFNIPDVY